MRLEALSIRRPQSYEANAGQLVGILKLTDANCVSLEVPLTPRAISNIVACIASEVTSTLRTVTAQAPRALQQAQDEGYLLENDGNLG